MYKVIGANGKELIMDRNGLEEMMKLYQIAIFYYLYLIRNNEEEIRKLNPIENIIDLEKENKRLRNKVNSMSKSLKMIKQEIMKPDKEICFGSIIKEIIEKANEDF